MLKFVRLLTFSVYSLMCFGVAAYAFYFIFQAVNPYNIVANKLLKAGLSTPIHVFASGMALFLVPFQLSKKLRIHKKTWHKYLGYLYVFSVILGTVSGYGMAINATGGPWAKWGFGMLAIMWLPATLMAVFHATKGNVIAHKQWMYRSIALTSAAITFRIYLGLGMGFLDQPFLTIYVPITWLCWAPNLIIVEWIIQRKSIKRRTITSAFA